MKAGFTTAVRVFAVVFALILLSLPLLPSSEAASTAPKWISLDENRGGVTLRWFRVQGAIKYRIYRRIGESGELKQVGESENPAFDDFKVSSPQTYFYAITAVDRYGVEGERSETRFIRLAPPEPGVSLPPEWASHQVRREGIALAWTHKLPDNVIAYNLYRRKEGESSFNLLTSAVDATYLDRDVLLENRYEYVLTALDKKLQESDNSSVLGVTFQTFVSAAPSDDRLASIKTLEEVTVRTELVVEFTREIYDFVSPVDVEYSGSDHRLYVSDSGTGLITVIDLSGEVLTTLGGLGQQPWEFERLMGIAVDSQGYIYAADAYRGEVVVFSSRGQFDRRIKLREQVLEYFGSGFQNRYPWFRFGLVDIAVREGGGLLVVDNPNGWVYVLDVQGNLVRVISEKGSDTQKMHYPTFLDVDSLGRLIVSDTLNSRLQVFGQDGGHKGVFGQKGLGIGQFLRPKGIVVDTTGNVYVADSQLNVIQMFDGEGQFTALLSNERGLPIDLGSPNGLAFAEPDLLFVCEKLARRVQARKILPITSDSRNGGDVEPPKKP